MSDEQGAPKMTWREAIGRVRGARSATAGGRRFFVGLAIAALVVTVFALVPGYLALQPSFLQRYSNLSAPYRSWSTSVHANVSCQRCHVGPELPAQAVYGVRMLGEFYLSFLTRSKRLDILGKPASAACSSCHIEQRTVSPSGDLKMPHRAHVVILKLECIRCHAYLVHDKSPEGKHTPAMAACLTCHDGRQAKNACSTCHTDKAAPASHRAADWVIVHARRQQGGDCEKCHRWTTDWCAHCHSSRPPSHGAQWRTTHGARVKARRNCEACHDASFCIRCHGAEPMLNFDPALTLVR